MRLGTLLTACVAGLALQAAPAKDATFQSLARVIVEDTLRFSPEGATQLGDHRWDYRLQDLSARGVAEQIAWARHMSGLLRGIRPEQLSPANRVDREVLLDILGATLQDLAELEVWRRNPLMYNPGGALDGLLSRDFASPGRRLASVKGRLQGIPALLAAARANLDNPPRIFTETAIQQFQGTLGLVRDGVTEAAAQAGLKEDLAPAQAQAARALEDFIAWLKADLLPRSNGDFRIGKAAFRKRLGATLSSGLTPEAILVRAEASLKAIHGEMAEVARPLHRAWFPDRAGAGDRDAVKAVLDRIAERHPDNATIVAQATRDLAEATDFVRAHGIVTLPTSPVRVKVTPEYARGVAGAYCETPGPLEKNGTTFFCIDPTPADWSPARAASYFREYNDAMLKDLTVHEAMPGHYLQGAVANLYQGPTLVRAVFSSGLFAEGWAVYGEQVMARMGFGGPEVRLQQLKMRLRVTINAILDQKIHTAGMTEAQALKLMMDEGFQEEGEAVGKWKRACLTSTQLSTYFVGAAEMDDLRAAAEARAKRERKPFDQKAYHDQVLGFGTLAPKFVRRLMGL